MIIFYFLEGDIHIKAELLAGAMQTRRSEKCLEYFESINKQTACKNELAKNAKKHLLS